MKNFSIPQTREEILALSTPEEINALATVITNLEYRPATYSFYCSADDKQYSIAFVATIADMIQEKELVFLDFGPETTLGIAKKIGSIIKK